MKSNWLVLLGFCVISVFAKSSLAADERLFFGWSGTGGANLDMFSKNYADINRAGEMGFVYGGSATAGGDVTFYRYNGTTWTEKMSLDQDGTLRINIGRSASCGGCKLAVNGVVKATEVNVAAVSNWPDYVFSEGYQLRSIEEVESFVEENGHLPGMPSAASVSKTGVSLGDMNAKLLEKIEELTLYMIDLKKENKKLQLQISNLTN